MAYCRDRVNPEAVHFSAQDHIVVTYACLLLALAATAILTLIYDRGQQRSKELAVIASCAVFIGLSYPKRITTDEAGVHATSFYGVGQRLIRWDEVVNTRERALIPGVPPLSAGPVGNWVIEVQAVNGVRPIRFTCRYSGREAFRRELQRWGAAGRGIAVPNSKSAHETAAT